MQNSKFKLVYYFYVLRLTAKAKGWATSYNNIRKRPSPNVKHIEQNERII